MRIVTFTSDRFRPYLPDRCQVNPNVLGFELAEWLSRALAGTGIIASYPSSEDWGWYLEFTDDEAEYLICCSGSAEDEGHAWRVYVERPRKLFRRPSRIPLEEELLESVADVLRGEGIEVTFEDG